MVEKMKEIIWLQWFSEDGAGDVGEAVAVSQGQEGGLTNEGTQPETVEAIEQASAENEAHKPSWEEILADPEYRQAYDKNLHSMAESRRQAESRQSMGRAVAAREHLDSLRAQAAELSKTVPGFDLKREMENPGFVRLTAPHTGLSVEQAYYAVHHRELTENMRQESMRWAVKSLRSGAARPEELKGGQSASTAASDPRQMSREQRAALKKRIYEASAQGKKLPYGG
jgi:hypothetical protein